MIAIVDTSVAIKRFVAEPGSDRATAVFSRAVGAPNLILFEFGNAMWKKVRRREIEPAQATGSLEVLRSMLILLPDDVMAESALKLGLEFDHPIYDLIFLLMAAELQVPLITADTKLLAHLKGSRYERHAIALGEWTN